jgi:hypothetical protein
MQQIRLLANVNDEVDAVYKKARDEDILLGCSLPWKERTKNYIPTCSLKELMTDRRDTSCFVIKCGIPSESIARTLWESTRTVMAAEGSL